MVTPEKLRISFCSYSNKNYIRINITAHSSNFYILYDEKIASIYKAFYPEFT